MWVVLSVRRLWGAYLVPRAVSVCRFVWSGVGGPGVVVVVVSAAEELDEASAELAHPSRAVKYSYLHLAPMGASTSSRATAIPAGEITVDGLVRCRAIKSTANKASSTMPTIVLLTDVGGLPQAGEFPGELVKFGFHVLIVDVFRGQPWDQHTSTETYEVWRERHTADRVDADVSRVVAFLADKTPVVIVGLCFGGGAGWRAAEAGLPGLCAAVLCYPTRVEPSATAALQVPTLVLAAEEDTCAHPTLPYDRYLSQLRAACTVRGIASVEVFPGTAHGFVHRPPATEAGRAAAAAAVKRIAEFAIEMSLKFKGGGGGGRGGGGGVKGGGGGKAGTARRKRSMAILAHSAEPRGALPPTSCGTSRSLPLSQTEAAHDDGVAPDSAGAQRAAGAGTRAAAMRCCRSMPATSRSIPPAPPTPPAAPAGMAAPPSPGGAPPPPPPPPPLPPGGAAMARRSCKAAAASFASPPPPPPMDRMLCGSGEAAKATSSSSSIRMKKANSSTSTPGGAPSAQDRSLGRGGTAGLALDASIGSTQARRCCMRAASSAASDSSGSEEEMDGGMEEEMVPWIRAMALMEEPCHGTISSLESQEPLELASARSFPEEMAMMSYAMPTMEEAEAEVEGAPLRVMLGAHGENADAFDAGFGAAASFDDDTFRDAAGSSDAAGFGAAANFSDPAGVDDGSFGAAGFGAHEAAAGAQPINVVEANASPPPDEAAPSDDVASPAAQPRREEAQSRYKFAVTGPRQLSASEVTFALQVWAVLLELLASFKEELESLKVRDEHQLGPSKFTNLTQAIKELTVRVAVDGGCVVEPAEEVLQLDDGIAGT